MNQASTPTIAITALCPEKQEQAQALSRQLNLPLINDYLKEDTSKYTYFLVYTQHFLGLQSSQDKKLRPFYIDFLSGKMLYRSQHAGFRRELLAKCIKIKPNENPLIIDATAGLGRDSFILATLSYQVTLIEQSPIIHALLADAIDRALNSENLHEIASKLTLIQGNSIHWLQDANHPQADIIYLDPMFPERKKSSSVKKEMVILQNLLPIDDKIEDLFNAAITHAKQRVIVKRPRLAANITARSPNFCFAGKSSRFDVYLTSRQPTKD